MSEKEFATFQPLATTCSKSETPSTVDAMTFIYRITLGELPVVTGVFPLGGKIGTKTTLAAAGWLIQRTICPATRADRCC